MTRTSGAQTRILGAALALAISLLIVPAAALAGSGGLGPGGGSGSGGDNAVGEIEGVPRPYAKFSKLVAGKTKLSLRVLGAWTLAEGGPRDNPLNIGPGKRFGTVGKSARATTRLLRHSLYRRVIAAAGDPDLIQIKAIASSPWCPGCRGYKRLLRNTYRHVAVSEP